MSSQPKDSNVSQDVITRASFSAPPTVAGLYQPPPDRAPFESYSDGLGCNLSGSAAVRPPMGSASLPCISFRDLVIRVRGLERSCGFVPDSFLASLRGITVFDIDHAFAVGGDSIADVIVSSRMVVQSLVSFSWFFQGWRHRCKPFMFAIGGCRSVLFFARWVIRCSLAEGGGIGCVISSILGRLIV